jgi:hypothetical protein
MFIAYEPICFNSDLYNPRSSAADVSSKLDAHNIEQQSSASISRL